MDEVQDIEGWKAEFLNPEAKEVVEAVGAWIYCFQKPPSGNVAEDIEETLKAIQDVSEEHAGYVGDAVMLAVAVPKNKDAVTEKDDDKHAEWEDMCLQYGFEYIDYSGHGVNEFREKTGFERVKEALEANEWAATGSLDDELIAGDLGLDDDFDIKDDFARDEAEMTAELFGMKAALNGSEDFEPDAEDVLPPGQQQTQVEDLDRLMGRLLAVKEQSADLPEPERKRMAARAVRELMDENPNA